MESKATVIWRTKAEKSLQNIYNFIANDSVANAGNYIDRMISFGHSLADFPDKYPTCRQNKFAKRNLRCAAFHHTYIFVYKGVKSELIIYNVIHGKRLK
ncbi:MAG: type II toxin-antitoxin system RelE/ParE family toxin [Bacteroidetes bacterium]|nr:MAG: type II toxin-antitoxin system RelE/ParE family toxin [Bacteroidota bacterium]